MRLMFGDFLSHIPVFFGEGCTSGGLIPSLWDGLCTANSNDINISSVSDVVKLLTNLVRIIIGFAGLLAVLAVIVASVYYVISMGDPGRIKRAKDILVNLVIGLVLLIAAYAIVTFVSTGFGS